MLHMLLVMACALDLTQLSLNVEDIEEKAVTYHLTLNRLYFLRQGGSVGLSEYTCRKPDECSFNIYGSRRLCPDPTTIKLHSSGYLHVLVLDP